MLILLAFSCSQQLYLAIYFCIADIILFGQWIYYSRQDRYKRLAQHDMPDIVVGDLPEISETDHHRQSFHPTPSPSSRPRHSRRTTSATVSAAPKASTTATAILPLHHDLVQGEGADLGSDLEQAENLSPLMHRPRTRRATTASDISHRRRYIPFSFHGYGRGADSHLTVVSPSRFYTVYCCSTSIVLFGLMLLTLRQTWPTDSTLEAHFGSGSLATNSLPVKGRVFARADLSQDEANVDEPTDVNIVQLGRIFAWVCTVFYLSSRMPQLWKNVRPFSSKFSRSFSLSNMFPHWIMILFNLCSTNESLFRASQSSCSFGQPWATSLTRCRSSTRGRPWIQQHVSDSSERPCLMSLDPQGH